VPATSPTTYWRHNDWQIHPMNDTNSPLPPRPTLKLKAGARKPAEAFRSPAIPQSDKSAKLKPGAAHWSDEYKRRMQADMDALLR
jgi:hypothetical protein